MKKRISETEINDRIDIDETYDEAAEAEARREKKLKRRKRQRVWDRIAGFIIISGIIIGCACLTLEYIIVKGPSPALRDIFISIMDETRRFKFIPQIFLTADELKEIRSVEEMDKDITTDTSLITIQAGEAAQTDDGKDAYGLVDDDGDGIIFTDIKGNGFVGYMITVLDPSRVFVGMPDSYGGVGLTLQELVNKYGPRAASMPADSRTTAAADSAAFPRASPSLTAKYITAETVRSMVLPVLIKRGSSTSGTSSTMILLPPGSSTAYPLVLSSSPTVSLLPLSILRAASIQEQPSHSVQTARSSCSLSTDASCTA